MSNALLQDPNGAYNPKHDDMEILICLDVFMPMLKLKGWKVVKQARERFIGRRWRLEHSCVRHEHGWGGLERIWDVASNR